MTKTPGDLYDLRPRRVCLIKPSALGDVVHALPTLSALRALWPEASISWIVNRSLRGLLDGHPYLDDVIVYDRAETRFTARGICSAARFLAGLRHRRFDLAIDLQGLLRSGLMTVATGAPVRIGMRDAREGAARAYTHRVDAPRTTMHAVERCLRVAAEFGANVAEPRFVVATGDEDRLWARDIVADLAAPRVVLNLGARWLTKRWPPAYFAEIGRRAARDRGAALIAVGAPEDRPLVDELRATLGPIPVLDLCGRTTFPRLAALAGEADLLLSNDTGPLHLAAAAGARVVGIYTCTDPRLTGPYGPRAATARSCVWCAPSFLKTCPRLECMAELTPDRVWPVVAAQLDKSANYPQMTQIKTDKNRIYF